MILKEVKSGFAHLPQLLPRFSSVPCCPNELAILRDFAPVLVIFAGFRPEWAQCRHLQPIVRTNASLRVPPQHGCQRPGFVDSIRSSD
eukprot:5296045-Amphidinium_carterae.2